MAQHHGGWVILLTFTVALLLTLLPMPPWAAPYRPEWTLLVLLYWIIALPQRVGIGTAWLTGLFMDVIRSTPLGEHALAFSLMAYLCLKLYRYFRVYPLWQQSLGILLLVSASQLLRFWIRGVISTAPGQGYSLSSALASTLLWPWLFIVMRDLRRRFRVQ
jgi:rod shape-determining protein MreD